MCLPPGATTENTYYCHLPEGFNTFSTCYTSTYYTFLGGCENTGVVMWCLTYEPRAAKSNQQGITPKTQKGKLAPM
jgi:hypothetical protein